MKVITNNFQALEGTNEFIFNKGINVIVGPNASGKSSLFYAIQNALTNPNGVDECIHYDHKSTEVTIENNDNSVTWVRNNSSSTYIDNKFNKQYVKASKLDSRDIADLGFYFDNKNKVVNIHDEWSVLFPFGESDTDMFRLFEDIFNISCSFQIIDEIKKDEQSIKSSINSNQQEKCELQQKLVVLSDIKQKIDSQYIDNLLTTLQNNLQFISGLKADISIFINSYPYTLTDLPQVFDITNLYNSLHKYEELHKDYETYVLNKSKQNIIIPIFDFNFDIIEPVNLRYDYEQYCTTKAGILEYGEEINKLKDELHKLQDKLNLLKVCPTCGRSLEE